MKRKIIIVTVIIVLGFITLFILIKSKRNPYNLLKLHTGIVLTNDCNVKKFIDRWEANGDGETLLIFEIHEKNINNLENKCKNMNYSKLPIKEDLPDNYIYNFISKKTKNGYYFLKTELNDPRNYTISIFDKTSRTLVVYYTIN